MPRREQIVEAARRAGIVGAGGGGFPAHVKLQASAEVVIANGAECEPLARVDKLLMAENPGLVLRGLELAMTATGAKRGILAVKKKASESVAALEAALRSRRGDDITIFLLDDFYPAGDEFVLVHEVLGRVIPEFGLPLSVGAVVQNVTTLADLARAVDEGMPVTRRRVAVLGRVRKPCVLDVPIGVRLSELVRSAGGPAAEPFELLRGGPMMGVLASPDEPVDKTTSLLVVLEPSHPVVTRRKKPPERQLHQTRAACLKCMLCTETCPRFLLGHRLYPDRLMRNLAAGISEDLPAFTGAYLCSECGLCAVYACVMGLDPCAANRMLKQRLSASGVPRPEPLESPRAHGFAEMRKVPVRRLMARLGVVEFDRPAEQAALEAGATGRLVLKLKQHAGAPAVPVVRKGERVSAGQPVAEPEGGKLGAVVHAPMAGRIVEIDQEAVVIDTGS